MENSRDRTGAHWAGLDPVLNPPRARDVETLRVRQRNNKSEPYKPISGRTFNSASRVAKSPAVLRARQGPRTRFISM